MLPQKYGLTEKVEDDFKFQLTKSERDGILMSKKLTSSWGGSRKLPYAFTEQGVYMLMTVLKGELETKQNPNSYIQRNERLYISQSKCRYQNY